MQRAIVVADLTPAGMRPFIVTSPQARKLPRWGLWLLCILYVLPGFIGRDPWRVDDAIGFGIALTMSLGTLQDWLSPNVLGVATPDQAPLPFALAALFARLLQAISPWLQQINTELVISPHLSVRLAAMVGVTLMLLLFWRASFLLARRPGVMPSDPLGAGALVTDLARAIADSGLLIVLGTFGLITRLHETTAMASQVTWMALFLYGMATSLERPQRGAVITGLAVAATFASHGIASALALILAMISLPWLSQPFALVRLSLLRTGLPVAFAGCLIWPLLVLIVGDDSTRAGFGAWIDWNLASFSIPDTRSLSYAVRYMPWFFWPAWPLAGWALFRWRGHYDQPAIALTLATIFWQLPLILSATRPGEEWLLPATLPMALLAAFSLPTLKRAVVNLIDWFAVMLFSLFGFAIWAYWLAFLTGWPPRMARSVSQLTPGLLVQWSLVDVLIALMASAAWILLVQWRISRRPPVIWRAVVLSSGGLCLAWFLLMTIWLPVFNERNTYRSVANSLAMQIGSTGNCVNTRALGLAERASIGYFARVRFDDNGAQCRHLLIQDSGDMASGDAPAEAGWQLIWEGRRRPNHDERFRLYRRPAAVGLGGAN